MSETTDTTDTPDGKRDLLRHCLATLAYRGGKAVRAMQQPALRREQQAGGEGETEESKPVTSGTPQTVKSGPWPR